MRILVDAREAVRNKSGIGVVARELIVLLEKIKSPNLSIIVVKPSEKRMFKSKYGRLIEFLWWKSMKILFYKMKYRCDYVFSLDPIGGLLTKNNIAIIYDLIFFVNKSWTNEWGSLWRFLLPRTINRNIFLFSISDSTTVDLKKNIKKLELNKQIITIPLGYDYNIYNCNTTSTKEEILQEFGITFPEDYILFVGNAEPRRNLLSVIKAIKHVNSIENRNLKLLVAGKNDRHKTEIERAVQDNEISSNFHLLGFVTDIQLAKLYKHAISYVYPSFYEGFGLTVIEAQACGCPVITSNNSSLKDVAKSSALLIDPYDQKDINSAITRIVTDGTLRNELISSGLQNVKRFGWEKCANKVVEAINHYCKT